jgi:cytochrome P450
VVTDLRALTHILTRATVFPKPEDTRNALRELFGEGLLVAEGATHRAQRRLLNKSAFAPNHVRNLSGVLLCKANEV